MLVCQEKQNRSNRRSSERIRSGKIDHVASQVIDVNNYRRITSSGRRDLDQVTGRVIAPIFDLAMINISGSEMGVFKSRIDEVLLQVNQVSIKPEVTSRGVNRAVMQ